MEVSYRHPKFASSALFWDYCRQILHMDDKERRGYIEGIQGNLEYVLQEEKNQTSTIIGAHRDAFMSILKASLTIYMTHGSSDFGFTRMKFFDHSNRVFSASAGCNESMRGAGPTC